MLNSKLFTRPFSCHIPRVAGYAPQIGCRITKVSRGKHAWRCETLVNKTPMAHSHHRTKALAEREAERMMDAYTEVHYVTK